MRRYNTKEDIPPIWFICMFVILIINGIINIQANEGTAATVIFGGMLIVGIMGTVYSVYRRFSMLWDKRLKQ